MDVFVAMVETFLSDAAKLEGYGAHHEAKAIRRCAALLETSIREWQLQALTLEEAEQESGFSYSALQGMVAQGKLLNAGEKYRPRVRRCDLPKKPSRRSLTLLPSSPDLVDVVLAAG
jgi:hypothetical protein